MKSSHGNIAFLVIVKLVTSTLQNRLWHLKAMLSKYFRISKKGWLKKDRLKNYINVVAWNHMKASKTV